MLPSEWHLIMSVPSRCVRRLVRLRSNAGHGPQSGLLRRSDEDRRQHARVRPIRRRQVLVDGHRASQLSVSGVAVGGRPVGTGGQPARPI